MSQSPSTGQPIYQQQPAAPSAPAVYPPQQQAYASSAPAAGQAYQPQQAYQGAPGQAYPQVPAGDSFVGSFFDTTKPFAEKYGKVFFYIVAGSLIALWLYNSYNAGDAAGDLDFNSGKRGFDFGAFLLALVFNALWTFVEIGLVRLFIELVSSSGKKSPQA